MTNEPTRWWTHAQVHTGDQVLEDHGVATRGGQVIAVGPANSPPKGVDETIDLDGATLAPGFVDLQVNGGGGATFTEDPDRASLETIAAAHRAAGTTAFLATSISALPSVMQRAADVVAAGCADELRGLVGHHLEGPFLDPPRTGAHDVECLRAPEEDDLVRLEAKVSHARRVTVSARHATAANVERMLAGGCVVSLGHAEATSAEAHAAFDHGVRGVTHLFNAMTGMTAREPGVVGAALARDEVHCGVIADGVHVDATTIAAAWRAKPTGTLHLVSDAIAIAGSDSNETILGGRRVRVVDGRCINNDGTLAGSSCRLVDAVRFCVQEVGVPLEEALRMASRYPAEHQGLMGLGQIRAGARTAMVVLDGELRVVRVITP